MPDAKDGLGLSAAEARRRQREFGPNSLPDAPRPSLWLRFLRQFQSSLIYVLLFALVVDQAVWWLDGAVGAPFESIAIAAILLLNAGMGVFQEYRAEDALARLGELEAPRVWVLRDGHPERIPSSEVVPGDAVRVEAGARIVADGCVDGESELVVDESILTGESVPVAKGSGQAVFSGTLVVRGTAFFEVTRTGAHSAMGRIAGMLGQVRSDRTPLEVRLDVFGHQVARWVMAVSVVLAAVVVAVDGLERLDEAFLFAVALAVAAVPEGLPAVLTLTLALGVERMSRRNAVVRKLSAVEALGSVTVIASDKTGTLTENEMTVSDIESPDLPRTLRAMVLASEAETETGLGDPLEVGLVRCACERGIDPIELRRRHRRQSLRAFDSAWKFMRVTVHEEGRPVSYLKGAPEVLLERCGFGDDERRKWRERAELHAEKGYRVLALACGDGEAERDLDWLGLVLFWDPPRPEVAGALRDARAAGIRVLMITGDHPATATAVAERIGIDCARVVTGAEIDRLSPEELARVVAETNVFGRVSPEHKLALVHALKARGEIVAMTGDGVNDAPALKRADVGVAMSLRGSDVTREVADLVLLDDNFATVVAAVEEGRNIYENIQKFIRFLFSTNVALVLLVAAGVVGATILDLRDPSGALLVPLTAAQLLWINIIADGPPALAVGLDRTPGLMERPPRPPDSPLLDRLSLRFILATGVAKAGLGVALLAALPLVGVSTIATRSAVFLYEALAQLAFVYPSRQLTHAPGRNVVLNTIVIVSVLAQPLVLTIPVLRSLLGLEELEIRWWGVVAASVVASWAFAEVWSRRAAAKERATARG